MIWDCKTREARAAILDCVANTAPKKLMVIAKRTLLKQSLFLASSEIASQTPLAMTDGVSFFHKEDRGALWMHSH